MLPGGTDLGLLVSKERQRPMSSFTPHMSANFSKSLKRKTRLPSAQRSAIACPALYRSVYPSFAGMIRQTACARSGTWARWAVILAMSPIGDTLPCPVVFEAVLSRLWDGVREIPIEDFFLDYRKTDLLPGEVIKSICIPKV